MTDLEMTRLCAEAMGYEDIRILDHLVTCKINGLQKSWNPLHDDAQAMALDDVILKHGLAFTMSAKHVDFYVQATADSIYRMEADMTKAENRRRARVECVAKMRLGKP